MEDPEIGKEVDREFEEFCKKLLGHVIAAADSENVLDRQFVARLIDYVSNSGNSAVVNTKIVKYMLTAFTKAIEMAGKCAGTDKDRKKAEKTVLVQT